MTSRGICFSIRVGWQTAKKKYCWHYFYIMCLELVCIFYNLVLEFMRKKQTNFTANVKNAYSLGRQYISSWKVAYTFVDKI